MKSATEVHGVGCAGEVGDEGVVVARPEEDGRRTGLDGEGGLGVVLPKTEAGKAEHKLVDLLLAGGGLGERNGVGDVVEEGAGDGEVGDLGGGIVAAGGGSGSGGDDQGADGLQQQGAGSAGVGDEGLGDGEAGLGGKRWRPAVDLGGVEERGALVASGERVAEKDGGGEVAGVRGLGRGGRGGSGGRSGRAAARTAGETKQRGGDPERCGCGQNSGGGGVRAG